MEHLYSTVYNDLYLKIKRGEFKPGDKIPTEKELSDTYAVSRITTRKALDMLQNDGLVYRVPGRGSFVCDGSAIVPEKNLTNTTPPIEGGLIGLIIEDFAENFGAYIVSGVEKACSASGFFLLMKRSCGSQEEEKKIIDEFRSLGVSGIVIMPVHGDSYNEAILKLVLDHFPTVLIDRHLKGMPLPYVGTDNFSAAKDLSDYLFEHGHKKICMISPPIDDTSTISDRKAGFLKSNEDRGILSEQYILSEICSTLPSKVPQKSLEADTERIIQFLLSNPDVSGILAVEYNIALIVKQAIEKIKETVSNKYEIVCFDSPFNYIQKYEFTHARQDEDGIGETAVHLLMKQLQGIGSNEIVELPVQLLEKTVVPV